MTHNRSVGLRTLGGIIFAGLALSISSAGCSVDQSESRTKAPVIDDKYTQTWTKSYADTTCPEWSTSMTDEQRWAGAADMLTAARNKRDGGSGLPPDSLIASFQQDVSIGCDTGIDSQNVAETGASVYLIGRDTYQP